MGAQQCISLIALSFIVAVGSNGIPSCTLDSVGGTVHIHCNISSGERWNFSQIRNWAKNRSVKRMEVFIQCQPRGELVLRRPIKAPSLAKLHVKSCLILRSEDIDFSQELFIMNDTIQNLLVQDSTYIYTTSEIWKFYVENYDEIIRKYYCLYPPSLRELVVRNVSYIINQDMDLNRNASETLYLWIDKYQHEVGDCRFHNLRYYELWGKKDAAVEVHQMLENSKLPQLQILNISSLMLTETPRKLSEDQWNTYFPKLELIDLSYNNIRSIEFHNPPPSGRSLTVDLSHNDISIVDSASLKNLKDFFPGLVNIRNNPFACNCSQKDFVVFLQNDVDALVEHYNYLSDAECYRPIAKQGFQLKELQIEDICEDSNTKIIYVLYICISLLVTFIIFVFLIKFRREIRVIIFTRFSSLYCLCLSESSSSSKADKDFDAFVSYSSLDETWVNGMCKKLETSAYGFKLCLHHKHFMPGACISDNIFESVERSRHTIMVLSPNFLQSEWCILEFRKAFHQSLIESERHLIVVLLQGLDESLLQSDMKHFLQTYTYLKASDIFFWERLMYSLSNCHTSRYHKQKISEKDSDDSMKETKASEALLSVLKTV